MEPSEYVLSVLSIQELFNHIFTYVDYFYKKQFRLVSNQCKMLIDFKLKHNKICDDLDEMIQTKKSKVIKEIYLDEYVIIFMLKQSYMDYYSAGKFLIKNKCYTLLRHFIKKINSNAEFMSQFNISRLTCLNYKILLINCGAIYCEQSMLFIHKFLNIGPCDDKLCYRCSSLLKELIKRKQISLPHIDKFKCDVSFLKKVAMYGSGEHFEKIYHMVCDEKKIINELNVSLMVVSLRQKIKTTKHTLRIIFLCIDHGANPYIFYNNIGCALDILDRQHFRFIWYVIDYSKKYFDASYFRCMFLKKIKQRKWLDILFYEKYIEPTYYFLDKILIMMIDKAVPYSQEYLELFDRLSTKKINDTDNQNRLTLYDNYVGKIIGKNNFVD